MLLAPALPGRCQEGNAVLMFAVHRQPWHDLSAVCVDMDLVTRHANMPLQAQMQALAAAQAQAQLQRQMLAQQQALLTVPTLAPPAAMLAAAQVGGATAATALPANDTQARKSREIYIGNLAIGTVTIEMLTELFNAALAGMVPDPVTNPPVLTVKMDTTGKSMLCKPRHASAAVLLGAAAPLVRQPNIRCFCTLKVAQHERLAPSAAGAAVVCPGRFAFVEFRTEELATTAMTLDKTELCGRQMNIGRPKGYVPGTTAATGVWGMAAALPACSNGLHRGSCGAADWQQRCKRQTAVQLVLHRYMQCAVG